MSYYKEKLLFFLNKIKDNTTLYGNQINELYNQIDQDVETEANTIVELFFLFNRVYNYSFNHNVDDMLSNIFK